MGDPERVKNLPTVARQLWADRRQTRGSHPSLSRASVETQVNPTCVGPLVSASQRGRWPDLGSRDQYQAAPGCAKPGLCGTWGHAPACGALRLMPHSAPPVPHQQPRGPLPHFPAEQLTDKQLRHGQGPMGSGAEESWDWVLCPCCDSKAWRSFYLCRALHWLNPRILGSPVPALFS